MVKPCSDRFFQQSALIERINWAQVSEGLVDWGCQ